ncbi:PREDICTED: acyl-coenzyme A thioesterase THEM4-like [Branchiostoma belcheri]|uniref:Acyl-coenzyme A thioesterase THEM4 n=1 Tax=Branchiostoma belcheri TaxID=7741 RepID=A0A6P5AS40_BRABE|nr:PREDICTED: acyl-coenzyme A thioesterase THEM4-like [Branchiostoma belcheri]
MALRNCLLLTRSARNSVFGAKPENFLPSCRLLHRCSLKVDAPGQFYSLTFLKEPSRVLNLGYRFSCRRLATDSAEQKKDGQRSGKIWLQTKRDDSDVDLAWPNEAWSDVAKDIFHQLNAGTENGDWKRHPSYLRAGERRLFSRNIAEHGKGFEYAVFVNKREQKAVCVCQFGPYLEGPPGYAHGGAVATLLDAVMGICAIHVTESVSLTANLNINYKNPIPLGSTALFHAKLDRQDDRKRYISAYVTSADGQVNLCEATGLFVKPTREQIEKAKNRLSQHTHSDKVVDI